LNLALDISKRYLVGKKSTNAINVITGISIAGITIGTAALILILSVFNGFEDLVSSLFNSFNPDLKVVPAKGVYFDFDDPKVAKLKAIKGVDGISFVLEEVVLFDYDGIQEAGYLKGVDKDFTKVTKIDSTIINGEFATQQGGINYAVLGSGIFNKLSVNPSDPITPIRVFAALKNNSPLGSDYSSAMLYPAGVFSISSEEDAQYIITNIDMVRSVINKPDATNIIEMKLNKEADETAIRSEITKIIGDNITIKNRYQQNESFLKIMNIEKWIAYLIACITLALISFNLVGALWMIVLDKKKDISVLKSIGMDNASIKKIVLYLGILIGMIGMSLGFVIAIIFYFLQKNYALIAVPPGFMIDAYPITLKALDWVLVAFTVTTLAILASIIPANRAATISTQVK
jgi:lipoprotein-releasing system permease protein